MKTTVRVFYNKDTKRCENPSQVWLALYNIALPTVQSYISDLYHDAVWVHERLKEGRPLDFYYGVGDTGTSLYVEGEIIWGKHKRPVRDVALQNRHNGRPLVFHCVLSGEPTTSSWTFTIEQIADLDGPIA